jgi:hypothetical protein
VAAVTQLDRQAWRGPKCKSKNSKKPNVKVNKLWVVKVQITALPKTVKK